MERARRLLVPGLFVEQITLFASLHAHARFHHALLPLSRPCFPPRNVHDGTCLLAYAFKRSRSSACTADGGRKGRGSRGWMQLRRAPELCRRLPRQTSRVGRPLPYCKRKGGPSKGASSPHVAMYVLPMYACEGSLGWLRNQAVGSSSGSSSAVLVLSAWQATRWTVAEGKPRHTTSTSIVFAICNFIAQ